MGTFSEILSKFKDKAIDHVWPDGIEEKCLEKMSSGKEIIYTGNEKYHIYYPGDLEAEAVADIDYDSSRCYCDDEHYIDDDYIGFERPEPVLKEETYPLSFHKNYIRANREANNTLTRVQKMKVIFAYLDSYDAESREKIVDTIVDYLDCDTEDRKKLLAKTFVARMLIDTYYREALKNNDEVDIDDIKYEIRNNIADICAVLHYANNMPVKITWNDCDEDCNGLYNGLLEYIHFAERCGQLYPAPEDFVISMLLDIDFGILCLLSEDIFCGFEKNAESLIRDFIGNPIFQLKSAAINEEDIPF